MAVARGRSCGSAIRRRGHGCDKVEMQGLTPMDNFKKICMKQVDTWAYTRLGRWDVIVAVPVYETVI